MNIIAPTPLVAAHQGLALGHGDDGELARVGENLADAVAGAEGAVVEPDVVRKRGFSLKFLAVSGDEIHHRSWVDHPGYTGSEVTERGFGSEGGGPETVRREGAIKQCDRMRAIGNHVAWGCIFPISFTNHNPK